MKKTLTIILVTMLAFVQQTAAQNTCVATLKHGDTTTLFYGGNALQQAHDAAENGDVITLSEGVFQSLALSKEITVRGAGMLSDSLNHIERTTINNFQIESNVTGAKLEGLHFINDYNGEAEQNITDITITRCKFDQGMNFPTNSSYTLVNSIICGDGLLHLNTQISALNCIMSCFYSRDSGNYGHLIAENCFIGYGNNDGYGKINNDYFSYKNCIIYPVFIANKSLKTSVTCSNCVCINLLDDDATILDNAIGTSNTVIFDYSNLFKTYNSLKTKSSDGAWIDLSVFYPGDSETFELTDTAAATYLGEDGTQVGIYGGLQPFTKTLSYPQATKVNVANKAEGGKLSVDIEFNGGE